MSLNNRTKFQYCDKFLSLGVSLSSYPNITRWFDFCSSKEPIQTVNKKMATEEVKIFRRREHFLHHPSPQTHIIDNIMTFSHAIVVNLQGSKVKQADVGKFFELPGAEMGKVVVRFPPEASG